MTIDEDIEQGKSLAGRKEYLPAIEAFRKALEKAPGNGTALFELGKACYSLRDYPQAREALSALVRAAPSHRDALMLLGKACREAGDAEAALRVFEDIVDRGLATADICRELGDFYRTERRYDRAEDLYERVLEEKPDDFGVLLNLVQLCNFEGKSDRALRSIERYSPRPGALDPFRANQLLNEREIAEKKTALASKPRILLVTLTNRCNLHCPMCGRGKDPWDIPERLKDQVVSLLPYLELITWQGGEVFLYPHFKALLEETKKYPDLKQIIITNALLINRDWAERLVDNGAVDLTISIDSVNKGLYERLRKGAEFEKLLSALDALNALRAGRSSRMVLTLRCAIMGSNYREMESFLEFAKAHRFDVLLIFPISGDKDPENIFARKDPEALAFLHRVRPALEKKADEYGIRLLNWLPDEKPAPERGAEKGGGEARPAGADRPAAQKEEAKPAPLCLRPWRQIAVNVEGRIFPECLCTQPAGTVFEDTFFEVWNNGKMQEYRRNILAHDRSLCNRSCCSGAVPPEHLKFIQG